MKAMREHTYIVTYIAADGQSKTESVIGRSHDAVVRFIKKQGGRVVHLDRDEVKSPSSRSVRHDVWAIVLFLLAAIVIVAYWWHKMR